MPRELCLRLIRRSNEAVAKGGAKGICEDIHVVNIVDLITRLADLSAANLLSL